MQCGYKSIIRDAVRSAKASASTVLRVLDNTALEALGCTRVLKDANHATVNLQYGLIAYTRGSTQEHAITQRKQHNWRYVR